MKTLKVKTIKKDFSLSSMYENARKIEQFDEEVNNFLSTIDANRIYQINYLNSAGSYDRTPSSVILAVITYFGE